MADTKVTGDEVVTPSIPTIHLSAVVHVDLAILAGKSRRAGAPSTSRQVDAGAPIPADMLRGGAALSILLTARV